MKKLLTILSFILLILICLVVMFCSNEKVTGVGGYPDGYDGWDDTPPNTIIQGGSWTYKVDGYRYTMTVEINAEDRTVSFISNNILLAKEKYDDVFSYNYNIIYYFGKGEGRMSIPNYGLLCIIPSDTNYIMIMNSYSNIRYNIVSGKLKPAMNIGADYNYNFALDMHYSHKNEEYNYSRKVTNTYNYTNLQLKLGKDNSIDIGINHRRYGMRGILSVKDINKEGIIADYPGADVLEKLDWDRDNKILTVISKRDQYAKNNYSFVFDFANKTATIRDGNNKEVKGYLLDKSQKYNVKRASGWYYAHRVYNPFSYEYALYFDCNPINQSVYGYKINKDTKTLNFIFKSYRSIYTNGKTVFNITNITVTGGTVETYSGMIVGNIEYYLDREDFLEKGFNFSDSVKSEEKPPHEEDLKYTELDFWSW